MASSQVSLPSTPAATNTSYDTYMQSLQQKLSSISMQNASTLLHVDSSAPTSGTATTEMLSPVQEFETHESPKHQFKNLNQELSKINSSRKDSVVTSPEHQIELQASLAQTELNQIQTQPPLLPPKNDDEKPEKTRRISRFKVSVVAEPDQSKLIKPDDTSTENQLKQVPSLQDIPSSLEGASDASEGIKLHDSVTLINNTMLQLQENVQTSYLSQAKTLIAAAPSGWTTENNETFEDMLGRQQAELNALIEAHRKQQIEYMKSITEVSKNSSSRKDS